MRYKSLDTTEQFNIFQAIFFIQFKTALCHFEEFNKFEYTQRTRAIIVHWSKISVQVFCLLKDIYFYPLTKNKMDANARNKITVTNLCNIILDQNMYACVSVS